LRIFFFAGFAVKKAQQNKRFKEQLFYSCKIIAILKAVRKVGTESFNLTPKPLSIQKWRGALGYADVQTFFSITSFRKRQVSVLLHLLEKE